MKSRAVLYGRSAVQDFQRIFEWLCSTASPEAALRVVERLESRVSTLDLVSERGTARDDLIKGLRIVGLGNRAVCAIRVVDTEVLVARVFYGGEDWESILRREGID